MFSSRVHDRAVRVGSTEERVEADGHLVMREPDGEKARDRARVIGRLADRDTVGLAEADQAAAELCQAPGLMESFLVGFDEFWLLG